VSWLVRDGDVLATAEVAETRRSRRRGLAGRADVDGCFVIRPCRQVHTARMRFAIDVAFVDRFGVVVRVSTLRPWRVSRIVWKSRSVIEARAGSFDRWRLRVGDVVEIKHT
jgi:uncharacterized membrane protein (UPF0127 family)